MFGHHCMAQDRDSLSTDSILIKYNDFLQDLGLRKLFQGRAFSFEKKYFKYDHPDSMVFNNVYVMRLEGKSEDRFVRMLSEWSDKKHEYATQGGIYNQLLSGLVNCSGISPDSIVIQLQTVKPGRFSLFIYFDQGIKISDLNPSVRAAGFFQGPGDLDGISYGGQLDDMPWKNDLDKKVIDGFQTFFYGHKHKTKIAVVPKVFAAGNLYFKVTNVFGEVTDKFHEAIYLNIILQKREHNKVNVSYFFTVNYAGGIMAVNSESRSFKNAVRDYHSNVSAYSVRLKEQLRSILLKN